MNNRDFKAGAGGIFPTSTYQVLTFSWAPQVPASESNVEYGSIRLPDDGHWQFVDAHVWAKAVASTPEIKLQDDGTDFVSATAIVAGAQTQLVPGSLPKRFAGGSELQVVLNTAAGETIDGLVVTVVVRPYPLGEGAVAVS